MLNLVFMGTPDFAKESLEAVYNKGHNIIGVFAAPDKPNGRGMKIVFSPVKEYSLEKNFKIYQPEKIKNNQEVIDEIKSLNPDVICVVAYGTILPKEILDIPKYRLHKCSPIATAQIQRLQPNTNGNNKWRQEDRCNNNVHEYWNGFG